MGTWSCQSTSYHILDMLVGQCIWLKKLPVGCLKSNCVWVHRMRPRLVVGGLCVWCVRNGPRLAVDTSHLGWWVQLDTQHVCVCVCVCVCVWLWVVVCV